MVKKTATQHVSDNLRQSLESAIPVREGRYRSYSFEDRLKAISMSDNGMSSIAIGREMGIDSSVIRGWIRRYRKEGLDGLKRKHCKKIPNEHTIHQPDFREDARAHAESAVPTGRKGFVHFVDNPALVRSMVSTLCAFGIKTDDIAVGYDVRDLSGLMTAGETLVVNSLFDLSSDFSKMMYILCDLLKAGITIVSISDRGQEIRPGDMDSVEMVTVLKNYLSAAWTDVRQYETGDISMLPDRIIRLRKRKKEDSFSEALNLYMNGHTMASAARTAGCSYTAFRYWLFNKKKPETAMKPSADDIVSEYSVEMAQAGQ